LIRRKGEAGFIGHPLDDITQHAPQNAFTQAGFVAQREVEILRETVSLEVALLQACTALEHPRVAEFRM
jgi:hypothetical protein